MNVEYAAVEFLGEDLGGVIPQSWLRKEAKGYSCYWPPNNAQKRSKRGELPDTLVWQLVPVRTFITHVSYARADEIARRSFDTSNVESGHESQKKRSSRKPARYGFYSDDNECVQATKGTRGSKKRKIDDHSSQQKPTAEERSFVNDSQVPSTSGTLRKQVNESQNAVSTYGSLRTNFGGTVQDSQPGHSRKSSQQSQDYVEPRPSTSGIQCRNQLPTPPDFNTFRSAHLRTDSNTKNRSRTPSDDEQSEIFDAPEFVNEYRQQAAEKRTKNPPAGASTLNTNVQEERREDARNRELYGQSRDKENTTNLSVKVETVLDNQREILCLLRRLSIAQPRTDERVDFEMDQQCASEAELEDLETQLREKEVRHRMVDYLSTLGGHDMPGAVRIMMRRIASNAVWCAFSLRGLKRKRAFNVLRIYKIVHRATQRAHPQSCITEIDNVIGLFLKYAPHRQRAAQRNLHRQQDNNDDDMETQDL